MSGSGHDLYWQVQIDGQRSTTPFQQASTTYAAPIVLAIAVPAGGLSTAGGETITLTGVNFGPVMDGQGTAIGATFGASASAHYPATGCRVTVNDTTILCMSAAGYGSALRWAINVNGVSSAPSAATVSFGAPTLTSTSSDGIGGTLATAGGSALTIIGTNFGPFGTPVAVQYGPSYSYCWKYTATGCTISVASTHVNCQAVSTGYGTSPASSSLISRTRGERARAAGPHLAEALVA